MFWRTLWHGGGRCGDGHSDGGDSGGRRLVKNAVVLVFRRCS